MFPPIFSFPSPPRGEAFFPLPSMGNVSSDVLGLLLSEDKFPWVIFLEIISCSPKWLFFFPRAEVHQDTSSCGSSPSFFLPRWPVGKAFSEAVLPPLLNPVLLVTDFFTFAATPQVFYSSLGFPFRRICRSSPCTAFPFHRLAKRPSGGGQWAFL